MNEADFLVKISQLLDQMEIETLHQRYLLALDGRDCPAFLDCFTADAVVAVVGTTYQGHRQIADILDVMDCVATAIGNTRTNKKAPLMRHITCNHAIEIQGTTARLRANWLTLLEGDDGPPTIATMGHYCDEVAKISGVWRFTKRRIIQDMPR